MLIPLIGEEGQKKLSEVKVLQIGAGGLGSPCSMYLTAAGIKELTIIDNDTVSLSNLHRQLLYNENDIGKLKNEVARTFLTKLNSDVKINTYR